MAEEKKMTAKNIGIDVKKPENSCNDQHCPFHGTLSLRGKTFVGEVKEAIMDKTAVVTWERRKFNKKYERYEKRRTKLKAHNPPCLDVKVGDKVKIVETRPLSKTVNFVIVEVLDNLSTESEE